MYALFMKSNHVIDKLIHESMQTLEGEHYIFYV